MTDQKNTILAIVLSAIVLIAWQYFVGMPQMEKQRQEAQLKAQQQQTQQPATPVPQPGSAPQPGAPAQPGAVPAPQVGAPSVPGQVPAAPRQALTREAVIKASPRIAIETPKLSGSVSLKGGRLDDLALTQYRETVDPKSPPIVLLSPSDSPHPFYAQVGWTAGSGAAVKLPDDNTVWRQQGAGTLGIGRPVTLTYDNGEGLEFRRTISVDDKYLFTVDDQVANKGSNPVSLFPYALISRHGTPKVEGFYILHEGLIGVMGDQGLQEVSYGTIDDKKTMSFKATNAWLGITDKYWAAALLPDTKAALQVQFQSTPFGTQRRYQTDYLGEQQTIAPGATATHNTRLFAGAKEIAVVDGYEKQFNLNRFELLIDWGWFYFITKPMFVVMDWIYHRVGNFGLAILIVTVLIKLVFFPLANKSYASMAKMKAVQPEMMMIRERYADDKMKQQQALMELYKKEQINPLAGCLPILIQVPVFFALYKVLFVTIEMRHAPFYGWIKDLSAPDPTNLFNLFGLIPFDPTVVPVLGQFLHLGFWPIVMGITMWFQMKLNPAPPDPTQKMIFDWMPLIFTFMLASFSAGLVIYWAWNNTLSVLQQSFIMRRHGAKIELGDNIKDVWNGIKSLFGFKDKDDDKKK
ncbi:MAG: membrane protein insertase YidC [Xanthobacteraceae bacterium]|jgi:YidC/Oxa1 family membrane protein insertase